MSPSLKAILCSANMGNAEPNDSISNWIPRNGERDGVIYDVIVIGMQEATFKKRRGSKEVGFDVD